MPRERYIGRWKGAKTAITMLKARRRCAAAVYADMETCQIWARAVPEGWEGYPKPSIREIWRVGPEDEAPDMAALRDAADDALAASGKAAR